jgi:hypothetical protein
MIFSWKCTIPISYLIEASSVTAKFTAAILICQADRIQNLQSTAITGLKKKFTTYLRQLKKLYKLSENGS